MQNPETMPLKPSNDGADCGKQFTITKRSVNLLVKPSVEEGRQTLWDGQLKGFGLRHYPTGKITFVIQFRMNAPGAKTQTITIGQYGSPWTPDAARSHARDLLEKVRKGVDPISELRAERDAVAEAHASAKRVAVRDEHNDFDAFADRYIARHVKAGGLRSLKDIEGTFARDLRPFFRGRSILDITNQDCKDMRALVGQRSHSAGNKAHKWLNAAFIWGIEHDGLTSSPMIALKRPFKEPKRTRVLAEWELALIWSILPEIAWPFAMLMRLLILIGQRLREVAGVRWDEIDLEKLEWIVPASRTKNKRDHLVPLSPQVYRLLVAIQPDESNRHGLLLTTNGRTPVSGFSKSKEEMDDLIEAATAQRRWSNRGTVAPWVRHDARRTFSTMCGQMRVPLAHAEAVLNHVSGKAVQFSDLSFSCG